MQLAVLIDSLVCCLRRAGQPISSGSGYRHPSDIFITQNSYRPTERQSELLSS